MKSPNSTRCAVAFRMVVFLVLGAMTTTAVSWGFAFKVGIAPGSMKEDWNEQWYLISTPREEAAWLVGVQTTSGTCWTAANYHSDAIEWARTQGIAEASFDALPAWSVADDLAEAGMRPEFFLGEHAYGWPMVALRWRGTRESAPGTDVTLAPYEISGAMDIPGIVRWQSSEPRLPITPCPIGFLVDTACFSVLWAGAVLLVRGATRHARRRRGKCVRCGYLLKGIPSGRPCPECGHE